MSKPILNPELCKPELCPGGVCPLRRLCDVRAIYQPDAYEVPALDWSRCRSCAKCVGACPERAISLVNG